MTLASGVRRPRMAKSKVTKECRAVCLMLVYFFPSFLPCASCSEPLVKTNHLDIHTYIYHKESRGVHIDLFAATRSAFAIPPTLAQAAGWWRKRRKRRRTDVAWSWMAGRSRGFSGIFLYGFFISLHYHIYLCPSGRRLGGFLQPSVTLLSCNMLHSGPFWLESWSDLALWGLKVAMEKSLFVAPRQIRQISVLAGQGDFPWDYYMNILYTLQYIYICFQIVDGAGFWGHACVAIIATLQLF